MVRVLLECLYIFGIQEKCFVYQLEYFELVFQVGFQFEVVGLVELGVICILYCQCIFISIWAQFVWCLCFYVVGLFGKELFYIRYIGGVFKGLGYINREVGSKIVVGLVLLVLFQVNLCMGVL